MSSTEKKTDNKPDHMAWWVIGFFVFIMLVSSWTTSQYVAYRFGYQNILGQDLVSFFGIKVYSPFAWLVCLRR